MVICALKTCKNYSNKKNPLTKVRFFSFPQEKNLLKQWISVCDLQSDLDFKNIRICSAHFVDSDYLLKDILLKTPIEKRKLNKNAIPSVNVPNPIVLSNRTNRFEKRSNHKIVEELIYNAEKENISYVMEVENNNMCETSKNSEILVNFEKDNTNLNTNQKENSFVKDVGTQTMVDFDNGLQRKILDLESEIRKLKSKLKKSETERTVFQSIKNFFTEGQIKKLCRENKRIVWKAKDISTAISLHSAGPRLYRYMCRKGYPLPATSTLRTWASKKKIKPGTLECVLEVMKNLHYNEWERLCVISFDEMKIKSCYEYDKVLDSVMSPSNYAQVVMVRGLFKPWKQPIYYNFDSPMEKGILDEIIIKLENINFTVVAVTSDLGSTNSLLKKKLQIDEKTPFFTHPSDQLKKIFVFNDVPHLIKLVRNHFIDSGFLLDGKLINIKPIAEIIEMEKSDLKINHKVTATHLEVKRAERQKVKYAVQLFSNSIYSCIRWAMSMGKCKSPNALECADFIKNVNDWFDLFNSKFPDLKTSKKPYGFDIQNHEKILDQMTNIMKNLRVCGRKNLLPFQQGIIVNNAALKNIFIYLKDKYKISYLLTSRFNQDSLENFFGIIRAKGGLHDHPTPLEFKYRLRSFILGRSDASLQVSLSSNTSIELNEINEDENMEEILSSNIFSSVCTDLSNENVENLEESFIPCSANVDEDFVNDSLEYLAGYIAKKLKLSAGYIYQDELNRTNKSDFTWVDEISQGGLKKPTEEFLNKIIELNRIFNQSNRDIFLGNKFIIHHLDLSKNIELRKDVKILFFKTRMYFRIKALNKEIITCKGKKKNKKQFT